MRLLWAMLRLAFRLWREPGQEPAPKAAYFSRAQAARMLERGLGVVGRPRGRGADCVVTHDEGHVPMPVRPPFNPWCYKE